MQYYTQSKLHNPPYSSGNCYITTICCLIGKPPEYGPNIETLFDFKNENNKGLWWRVLEAWLEDQGYELTFDDEDLVLFHRLCKNQLAEAKESFPQFADKYYMVSGDTLRGSWRHIVVYQNGQMVWDVHPTRAGIINESSFEFLQPITSKTGDQGTGQHNNEE